MNDDSTIMSQPFPISGTNNDTVSSAVPHQLSLDGENSISGCLTVALLARDDDRLGVTVLCWQVDLGGCLLADLTDRPFYLYVPVAL